MKYILVSLICLILCSVCLAEEDTNTELSIDTSSNFITNLIYICPIHGELSGWGDTLTVTINGEDKHLCPKCFSEFLYKNVTEVKAEE